MMIVRRFAAVAVSVVLVVSFLRGQEAPAPEEGLPELALISGEVVEVDAEAGMIVVHVTAVEDQEVEHFDLEVWIDEETLFENESDWEIAKAADLEGTLVDVEGFIDGDIFIADVLWIVEGPVEDAESVPVAA